MAVSAVLAVEGAASQYDLLGFLWRAGIFLVMIVIFGLISLFVFMRLSGLKIERSSRDNDNTPIPPIAPDPFDRFDLPRNAKATLSPRPLTLSEANEGPAQPLASTLPPPPPYLLGDYAALGEGGAVFNEIEVALADGRPGSVVRAASDINGLATNSPIIIVRREEQAEK